ncbi:GNAT family N-acetyltransferase [Paenibacillus sp. NFR01]|uniref:GNAT family N-acetyltransferase n=1 Tax=Paenibacillus sp. NFR01 TaxID=1566279 RepID=UPI0008D26F26|nr:GNAT family N-acetyltransferase [Paenibacillus sp. NFR01]SET67199.1 Acetyltransferase (GNAT) family protein [Paenibacillus sp. NFR01]
MVSFKRLNECVLDEAVEAWNEGFAGYFLDMTMSPEAFLNRLTLEGLSPALSFAAYDDGRPAGIVLNGIREIQGIRVAWNGGTGVVPEYRGKGISRALMDHALQIYREERVQLSTLEALSPNERAIRLYKSKGYDTVDRILYMGYDQALPKLDGVETDEYLYRHGTPQDIKAYEALMPWQSQWANFRRDGEALLVHEKGHVIAYALFKRTYDADGENNGISVGQVRILEQRADQERLLRSLLSKILQPERVSFKRTFPVLASNREVLHNLKALGFEEKLSQVWMSLALQP